MQKEIELIEKSIKGKETLLAYGRGASFLDDKNKIYKEEIDLFKNILSFLKEREQNVNIEMEAKNLRIGNLVGIKDTALNANESNHLDTIFEIEELNKEVARFKGFHVGEHYKDLKGVKLNDGLLSLYGFKKDGLGYLWIDLMTHQLSLRFVDGFYYPLYVQLSEMSHENEQRVFVNRIESLHELQNLFFAITGNELELTYKTST